MPDPLPPTEAVETAEHKFPVLGSQAADNAAWDEIRAALRGEAPASVGDDVVDDLTGAVTPILARLVESVRSVQPTPGGEGETNPVPCTQEFDHDPHRYQMYGVPDVWFDCPGRPEPADEPRAEPPSDEESEAIRSRVAAQGQQRPYAEAAASADPVAAFVQGHTVWAGLGALNPTIAAFADEVSAFVAAARELRMMFARYNVSDPDQLVAIIIPVVASLVSAAEQRGAEKALCLQSGGPGPNGGEYRCALRKGHTAPQGMGHCFEVWP